jgi:hypothetical protein
MSAVLIILLIAFCLQALVKFAVWFQVPYQTRIFRIASYYDRDGRIISFYDSITLIIMVRAPPWPGPSNAITSNPAAATRCQIT